MLNTIRHKWLGGNRVLERALERLAVRYDRPLAAATAHEEELGGELRRQAEAMKVPHRAEEQPSEKMWREFSERFISNLQQEDPRTFLRWPVIRKTMVVSSQPYLAAEWLHLRLRSDWGTRWRPALKESAMGHPMPFWAMPASSGTLIHHAYHLSQFEARTGRQVLSFPGVFEFGGGYGSMCRLFHQLGFAGRYVIFDLPLFSALQRYYLRALGLPVIGVEMLPAADRGIVCVSDPAALGSALAWAGLEKTLFVGTWSISETPASVRAPIMPQVACCQGVLIAYLHRFGEMNNREYFTEWISRQPAFHWVQVPIRTLPDHFYLFGNRTGGGV